MHPQPDRQELELVEQVNPDVARNHVFPSRGQFGRSGGAGNCSHGRSHPERGRKRRAPQVVGDELAD
jgi:hypothetical protein